MKTAKSLFVAAGLLRVYLCSSVVSFVGLRLALHQGDGVGTRLDGIPATAARIWSGEIGLRK